MRSRVRGATRRARVARGNLPTFSVPVATQDDRSSRVGQEIARLNGDAGRATTYARAETAGGLTGAGAEANGPVDARNALTRAKRSGSQFVGE